MDSSVLHSMTYGLYIACAQAGDTRAGCVVNTAVQVTSKPAQVSIAVNKSNVTAGIIKRAGAFALTVLDKTATMPFIGTFGFKDSDAFDKFAQADVRMAANGMPYVADHACGMIAANLVATVDVGSHYLFIGELVDAAVLSDAEPLTYAFYHRVLKGKTPPRASSYEPDAAATAPDSPQERGGADMDAAAKETYTFVCQVCGYEMTVDTPELPEGFVCPVCGVGPDEFDLKK